MTDTFTRVYAADYLKIDDKFAAYLEDAAQDDDPGAMAQALGTVARARNISKLARDTGLTREGIYKALSPEGNPAFATVVKVARAMGLEVTFKPRRVA
jgi:probable addiction module antidote protein